MTGTRPVLATLAVLIVVLAGCDSDRRAISRDDLPDIPSGPTVTVELTADGFDPDELEVTTVDLVEFDNVDDENHGVRTEDFAIDSGPLFPGESLQVIFDTPGRYTVVDGVGDEATMTVVVTAPVSP
jgi:plastocyanin